MKTYKSLDDVLEHYGILGMRWGVRRTPEQLARARGERLRKGKPVTPTKDAVEAKRALKRAKKGGVEALTNKELQQLNNRLNLEQNYNRLTSQTKEKNLVSKGYSAVKQIIGVGKTASEAYNLATSPMAKEIAKILENK